MGKKQKEEKSVHSNKDCILFLRAIKTTCLELD